jgi:hypothetical protein
MPTETERSAANDDDFNVLADGFDDFVTGTFCHVTPLARAVGSSMEVTRDVLFDSLSDVVGQ